MNKSRLYSPQINTLTQKVLTAAKDTLGNKLEKVILFGSYARGDFDDESDIDFFILANVPQEDASKWRSNIRKRLPLIDLEHDITVSLHVTGSSIFYQYADTLPYYMNIIREGVQLND
ncbi:MAG: nucleotidyltransferase domain-containing protein [Defluviitaleaceae bacterium]|nr:nucleotidyltransferase domain-containing protein [Defluviitaleaceae bacterium]